MDKLHIIQEDYREDPWKVLVCCILLNQTNNVQVRPLIQKFFDRWPNPESIKQEEATNISQFIKKTGFQNIKSKRIKDFSYCWDSEERDTNKFPGIGKYGKEAWRIFVEKDYSFIPTDKKLKLYLEIYKA